MKPDSVFRGSSFRNKPPSGLSKLPNVNNRRQKREPLKMPAPPFRLAGCTTSRPVVHTISANLASTTTDSSPNKTRSELPAIVPVAQEAHPVTSVRLILAARWG